MADVVSFRKEESNGPLLREFNGPVLRLTLNNPPANVLSTALMEALLAALEEASVSKEIKVVVIAATGKLFSAGHDLKEMTSHRADPDGGRAFFERTIRLAAEVMLTITRLPQAVIAEVDGLATAAGCQLGRQLRSRDLHRHVDLLHPRREYRSFLFYADGRLDARCPSQAGDGDAFDR
ncbi:enoyl-CoA hydratase/carnithine racemase [Sinorhizobium meliloti]|nr:enoyl-CoA hydratase/carnithine racemase [Sinorhizobium meliloti]GEC38310.1 hypothetical protein EME01_23820 [Sinorhizobium meliloti]